MTHPYRHSEMKTVKRRSKLWGRLFRRLWWRIGTPIAVIAGIIGGGVIIVQDYRENNIRKVSDFRDEQERLTKQHFNDWQAAIDKREQALNIREQSIQDTIQMNRCK